MLRMKAEECAIGSFGKREGESVVNGQWESVEKNAVGGTISRNAA